MQQLASFVVFILSVYSILIIIRIILSWGGMGRNRGGGFYTFIVSATDPYLAFFRRIPGLQRGMIDFSPVAALITLGIVQNIFSALAVQGTITLGLVLALITRALWSVFSFFLILFIILFVIRIILEYWRSTNSIQFIAILENLLKGTQERVHRYIFGGREVSVKVLLFASAVTLLAVYLLLRPLFSWLISMLAQLPI
ncbi:MAG: YggT family protein [Spirochaetota bacterium]